MKVPAARKTNGQILDLAREIVDYIGDQLMYEDIPNVYKYEQDTDAATVELRTAIVRYINRMYDERKPYLQKVMRTAMTTIAKKPRPGAKGLVRNPDGRKGKAAI